MCYGLFPTSMVTVSKFCFLLLFSTDHFLKRHDLNSPLDFCSSESVQILALVWNVWRKKKKGIKKKKQKTKKWKEKAGQSFLLVFLSWSPLFHGLHTKPAQQLCAAIQAAVHLLSLFHCSSHPCTEDKGFAQRLTACSTPLTPFLMHSSWEGWNTLADSWSRL